MLIGIAAGIVCYWAVHLKNKLGWDDALDVWGVHGIGGVLGTILLGVFAMKAINGQGGLLDGDTAFFFKEVIAVVGASAYAFLFSYLMLALINFITPVKVSEADEALGLDESLHGERAYDEGAL
jgi:Amt family ammonium transporter